MLLVRAMPTFVPREFALTKYARPEVLLFPNDQVGVRALEAHDIEVDRHSECDARLHCRGCLYANGAKIRSAGMGDGGLLKRYEDTALVEPKQFSFKSFNCAG